VHWSTTSDQETAFQRSAEAVGRREKTLEEHELYVEALLDGRIVPPRQSAPLPVAAIALGVVACAAVAGLVTLVALRGDKPVQRARHDPPSQRVRHDPPSALPGDAAIVRAQDRLASAVKKARDEYYQATLVTRAERSRRAAVTGGYCLSRGGGTYECLTHEQALDDPPGVATIVPPLRLGSGVWRVRVDTNGCWKAVPMDNGLPLPGIGSPPMKGCLQ
jgi:hypothetical protein